MLTLEDVKSLSINKIQSLNDLRRENACEYIIKGIGVIKIAKIEPSIYMAYAIKRLSIMSQMDISDIEKNIDYLKYIVKLSVIEPVLDDEAIDLLIDAIGADFVAIANTCIEINLSDSLYEKSVNAIEDFFKTNAPMYERYGTSIELLHKAPSEVSFTEEEWIQLIAYNRIKGKMHNTCRSCSDKDRKAVKTCFWCGKKYSEDDAEVGSFALLDRLAEE